jgi:hypothetical protein
MVEETRVEYTNRTDKESMSETRPENTVSQNANRFDLSSTTQHLVVQFDP